MLTSPADRPQGPPPQAFADLLREEVEALIHALPDAVARQWERSPVPRPREDTTERSSGGAPSRPVEDVVFDPRRMEVRKALREAHAAAFALILSSRALRDAVSRFDGEAGA